ncbi:hypothetical protein MRX96_015947 [Rhipicephalus microplus]
MELPARIPLLPIGGEREWLGQSAIHQSRKQRAMQCLCHGSQPFAIAPRCRGALPGGVEGPAVRLLPCHSIASAARQPRARPPPPGAATQWRASDWRYSAATAEGSARFRPSSSGLLLLLGRLLCISAAGACSAVPPVLAARLVCACVYVCAL